MSAGCTKPSYTAGGCDYNITNFILFNENELDRWIRETAKNAPTIEKVREITAKSSSLTKLLLDGR